MAIPENINKNVIPPLQPPRVVKPHHSVGGIIAFLEKILGPYLVEAYKHHFLMWNRTGAYEGDSYLVSDVVNLNDASSKDTTETDLLSHTLEANNLDKDGDYVEINAFGIFASNSNNKQVKLYFGSNIVLDSGVLTAQDGWQINSKIFRVDSNTQKTVATLTYNNSVVIETKKYPNDIGEKAQNVGAAIVIKVTGTGTVDDDITQNGLVINTSK